MDILRKELNEIYSSQHLECESLDAGLIDLARLKASTLTEITDGCAVITDAASDNCFIYSGRFGMVMGFAKEDHIYIKTDSSDEDIIYERIHPEDLVDKRLLEYEFFKFVIGKNPSSMKNHIAKCRLRMRDSSGTYRTVDNTTQLLTLSPDYKIWLILCTYSLAEDNNLTAGINPFIIDTSSGQIQRLALGEKRKTILTAREKEILILIKEGNSSKMIANSLKISIHTVNRYRQNIIEKLSVGNSIEAVTAASIMNLL